MYRDYCQYVTYFSKFKGAGRRALEHNTIDSLRDAQPSPFGSRPAFSQMNKL